MSVEKEAGWVQRRKALLPHTATSRYFLRLPVLPHHTSTAESQFQAHPSSKTEERGEGTKGWPVRPVSRVVTPGPGALTCPGSLAVLGSLCDHCSGHAGTPRDSEAPSPGAVALGSGAGASPALPRSTLCDSDSLASTPVPSTEAQLHRLQWSVVSISTRPLREGQSTRTIEKKCQDTYTVGKKQHKQGAEQCLQTPSGPDPHLWPRGWVSTAERENRGSPAPFCGNQK